MSWVECVIQEVEIMLCLDEVLYLCLYLLDFRMCLVEVEKSAKPVAACAMPVMNVSEEQ